ncbi:Dna repair protein xrcc3-like protein [Rhynchospora pubera]|uniref:Dna repair protein xrcc3-like protein n=1 Tax=Rhynchospora pubera TaxID=906938 RepID=A0AAV8CCL4_9POAL|nr:Dna repair protein xrcc3-like protein [Rhynchospora pubera]KAJ4752941.1 Dna repair protein xrcc3-like protein [Rhynchospora pubera]KAJ4794064.1 Dna repair protein xrcc3-like protein [Rhynchospora pubera]
MLFSTVAPASTSTSTSRDADSIPQHHPTRDQFAPIPIPLRSLLPHSKLSLGCPILSRLLSGGLPVGTLTEISGESATGKSQLCLQLLLSSLLPPCLGGLAASSLLILPSLLPFSSLLKRLSRLPSPLHPSPLDHIFVASAHSPDHLMMLLYQADRLFHKSPSLMPPLRLIVVDSIAAIFRSEFDNNFGDLKARTGMFFRVAAKLKEQASRFGAVAVVTNQVVDVMGPEMAGDVGNNHHMGPALLSSGRMVAPAMGLSWANCVNTRIFLSRNDEMAAVGVNGEDMAACTRRSMEVVFAPHVPRSSCEFVIRKDGVFGLDIERQ